MIFIKVLQLSSCYIGCTNDICLYIETYYRSFFNVYTRQVTQQYKFPI